MKGWFVTGTDTGVGKTFITSVVARTLTAEGLRVAAIKPIESGCRVVGADLFAEDAEAIAAAAGGWQAPAERCLYRFEEPVAPGVAADRTNQRIDVSLVRQFVDGIGARADVTLVEGAGGWLVPLGAGTTIADLAATLGFPVLVVSRATLGTINHTLLTVEAIERRGGVVAAVVLSARPEDSMSAAESNCHEIRSHWKPAVWIATGPGLPAELRAVFHVERPAGNAQSGQR